MSFHLGKIDYEHKINDCHLALHYEGGQADLPMKSVVFGTFYQYNFGYIIFQELY